MSDLDLDLERSVRSCYATWSDSYYEDYYTGKASYPPVHRALVRRLLEDAGAATILDAGCGPASMLRDLVDLGGTLYGFDLTPEMVAEARRVLGEHGVPPTRIRAGSVLDPRAFRFEEDGGPVAFDAALCVGVLPHVPEASDPDVIRNLHAAVRPGGTVILEARNQLFSLFTLNRYSHRFFLDELIRADELHDAASTEERIDLTRQVRLLEQHFRMDQPSVRKGKQDEPGYDEILSRTHNPLVLREQFAAAGFEDVRVLFYHFHSLPPFMAAHVPEFFHTQSLAMEEPDDWRGYFMASAFLLVGTKV